MAMGRFSPEQDIEEEATLTCGCMVDQSVVSNTARCSLQYLSLSGCYLITDEGLR